MNIITQRYTQPLIVKRNVLLLLLSLLVACGGGSSGSGGDSESTPTQFGVFLADRDIDEQVDLYAFNTDASTPIRLSSI